MLGREHALKYGGRDGHSLVLACLARAAAACLDLDLATAAATLLILPNAVATATAASAVIASSATWLDNRSS